MVIHDLIPVRQLVRLDSGCRGEGFGGEVKLCVVSVGVQLKSMLADAITKGYRINR